MHRCFWKREDKRRKGLGFDTDYIKSTSHYTCIIYLLMYEFQRAVLHLYFYDQPKRRISLYVKDYSPMCKL